MSRFRERCRRLWARVRVRRVASGGLAAVVLAPVALVLAHADGLPATRPELSGGGAWLASPAQGLVTLVDGASEHVVGSVHAPGMRPGDDLSVVQAGSSAYLFSQSAGTVARVDGATYQVSAPVQFGAGGKAGQLAVYAGPAGTYVVDGLRRIASVVDPVTLRVRQRLSLAAQPGPGQSAVDGAGRLWVVDRSGLAWFDQAGKHVRPDVGGPDSQLVLVGGEPVLVEPGRARAGRLSARGTVESWSCLDLRTGERAELLGSTALGRVLAALPATGVLTASGDGGEDCGLAVVVGKPGDEFGQLVESGGFVFVPNTTSGRTAVVDLAARRMVADLDVASPGNRLELLAKDGLVFYNDLDGDKAGVIRFDGARWRLGRALRKYHRAGEGDQILTPAGGTTTVPKPPQDRRPPAGAGPPAAAPPPADEPPSADPPAQPNPAAQPDDPTAGPPAPDRQGDRIGRVTIRVTGAGTVTALRPAPLNVPAGAVCAAGTSCGWDYRFGADVLLRVPGAPAPDVRLQRLSGCTSVGAGSGGDRLCRVRIRGPATVAATFAAIPPGQVTLTVGQTGSGTVTAAAGGGSPTPCTPTCSVPVPPGGSVRLAATPGSGSYLAGWNVPGCAATAATCDVTVAADQAVTVDFAPLPQLTVTITGTGAGSVSGAGLTCAGNRCSGAYQPGTAVTLTATADAASLLGGWSGCTANGASCTATVDQDVDTSVSFDANPIGPFVGDWDNVDPNANDVTQMTLDRTSATTGTLHLWGSCSPTDCDWGTATATWSGGELTASFDLGFVTEEVRIRQSGARLIIDVHHDFDDPNRADIDTTNTMARR